MPLLVAAFADAPEGRRAQLGPAGGAWLQASGLLGALHELDARQLFQAAPQRELVAGWLRAGGVEPAAPPEPIDLADLFVGAYEIGDIYQASPTLLWHSDARRRRVISTSFLIDNEPPWHGAVKDVAVNQHRDPAQARDRIFELWRASGTEPAPITAQAAKARVLAALAQNRAQGLRLPADLASARVVLMPLLFALPDAAGDEPQISPTEVEAMVTEGRSIEDLRLEERTLGFQTRTEDGSVIRLLPDDDEL